eukprot:TRINITY_DN13052_c0_g2_i2.p1 TRINITY_DN13052_c0_g2~~TRINITY_DN13052_c0_g2_i2.p1  ORF type:complete len:346 (+),score=147.01 TRINITY_DN13052_c0_g2_i2:94-1131(+)
MAGKTPIPEDMVDCLRTYFESKEFQEDLGALFEEVQQAEYARDPERAKMHSESNHPQYELQSVIQFFKNAIEDTDECKDIISTITDTQIQDSVLKELDNIRRSGRGEGGVEMNRKEIMEIFKSMILQEFKSINTEYFPEKVLVSDKALSKPQAPAAKLDESKEAAENKPEPKEEVTSFPELVAGTTQGNEEIKADDRREEKIENKIESKEELKENEKIITENTATLEANSVPEANLIPRLKEEAKPGMETEVREEDKGESADKGELAAATDPEPQAEETTQPLNPDQDTQPKEPPEAEPQPKEVEEQLKEDEPASKESEAPKPDSEQEVKPIESKTGQEPAEEAT